MSTSYSFNVFTGEIETSTSIFPVRITFGSTIVTPLVSGLTLKADATLGTKLYLQGGPGKSVYSADQRKISGNFKIPIRVTEDKELEQVISLFIDYTFFDQGSSCTPLAIRYFELETGFFKTAQGFFVPPGKSDYEYNSEFIQAKFNRCIITSLKIETSVDSDMVMSIEFVGTISKDVSDTLFTDESTISSIKSSFDINRVMSLHDCKVLINGSYIPNCTTASFEITREVVEKRLSRSFNTNYSPIFPGLAVSDPILNYSNDLPSKIGVKSFSAKISITQVQRKIDEDLYFSRGGKAEIFSSFDDNFIELYFGPIKVARTCALAQPSDMPMDIGAYSRSTTFELLNRPRVIEEDFISVITGGGW